MASDCATASQCPIILPLPTRGLAKLDMDSTVIVRTHVPGAPPSYYACLVCSRSDGLDGRTLLAREWR